MANDALFSGTSVLYSKMGDNRVFLMQRREATTTHVSPAVCALEADGEAVRHDGSCVFRHDLESRDFVLVLRHFHLSGI